MKAPAMQRTRIPQHVETRREGVAATEFAIVLPLFLTLVLGILEIGRSLETSTTMYSALREAGHEKRVQETTGLLLDPYFSATKIAWILDRDAALRRRAEKAGRVPRPGQATGSKPPYAAAFGSQPPQVRARGRRTRGEMNAAA